MKKPIVKKKRKSKNYYFGQEVQDEIVEYQNSESWDKRNKLYAEYISPAFNDLVQSLISVYKFKSANEDINHLKSDCVTFLFETFINGSLLKAKKLFLILML